MGRRIVQLLHHPHHLLELLHQVALVLQAASGIGDQHVSPAGAGSLDGVINDGSGVGTGVLGNHRNVVALTPHLQLLDGGSTEGIASGQHHALALGLELLGQLADGGGLADAVHADHQDDVRLLAGVDHQGLLDLGQHLAHILFEQTVERLGVLELLAVRVLYQPLDDAGGGVDAKIGGQQLGLQLFEQIVIDLLAAEQAEETGTDILPGTHQAALEAGKEALSLRLLLSVVVHLGGKWQSGQRGGLSLHRGDQTQIFRSLGLFGDTGFLGSLSFGGNTGFFRGKGFGSDASLFRSAGLGSNTGFFCGAGFGSDASLFRSAGLGGNTGFFCGTSLGGNTGFFCGASFGGNTGFFCGTSLGGNTGFFCGAILGGNNGFFCDLSFG